MAKFKYPHHLKGAVHEVVIYRVRDRGRTCFKIAYHVEPEGRKVQSRSDEAEAHRDAKRILGMLEERPPIFAETEDAANYRMAQTALHGLGVTVDQACHEYARARKALANAPLADAVAAYLRHKPVKSDQTTVQLVEMYLAELEPDASTAYFLRMQARLRRFARSFGDRLINTLAQDELEQWLRGLSLGKRARNNERQALVTLFNWCQVKRYLPRGVEHEAAQLKVAEVSTRPMIFTLKETQELMARLSVDMPELVPYAALGLFAGIRPAELARLSWEESLRWSHGDIEIRADQAKTGFRRLIPIQSNLRKWLGPFVHRCGPVALPKADRKLTTFAKSIGLPWPSDVMRHSFISYAVAVTKGVGSVAMWAGNSEAVIKRHYLEMVTEAEGIAYFAIEPNWPENIAHFRAA